jgi:hypothetical protein
MSDFIKMLSKKFEPFEYESSYIYQMRMIRHPVFRWTLTFFLLGCMGYQLWAKSDHFSAFSQISFTAKGAWIGMVIILMPLNWWLEGLKWRTFLSIHVQITFLRIMKAVAGGLAISLFTPNRIGEYGGRVLFMPPGSRWPAVISTLAGSMAQNLVGISAGIISCLFLFNGLIGFKIVALLMVCIFLLCYYQIRRITGWIFKININPRWHKWTDQLHYFSEYSFDTLTKALFIALGRYILYVVQFSVLLYAFEPTISPSVLFLGVGAIYLFQTLVPLPPFADVLARTNISLMLWAGSGMSELSISLVSFMVWTINLLIPAVIGSIAIGTSASKKTFDLHDPVFSSSFSPAVTESVSGN